MNYDIECNTENITNHLSFAAVISPEKKKKTKKNWLFSPYSLKFTFLNFFKKIF
jgi:hypothetical protein